MALAGLFAACCGLLFPTGTTAFAGELASANEETGGTCHALLVGGYPGSPVYSRRYRDWLRRVHSYLTETAGVPERQVLVISDDDGSKPFSMDEIVVSIEKALEDMAGRVRAADQFVLVLVGHGALTAVPPAFVVRGPDADAELFARGLNAIKARNQVVLNFTSSSGAFIKHIKGEDRVNIAANSSMEGIEPVYAEFFLRGLESRRADQERPGSTGGMGAPGAGRADGVITLLEAYNWATYQTALWISRQNYVEGGSWKVDGKESAEVFRKMCDGSMGTLGARRLARGSREDIPDEIVRIRPGSEIPWSWSTRRILSERASLEDCGEEVGISALSIAEAPAAAERAWDVEAAEPTEPVEFKERSDADFRPLAGREKGEPGHLARRVVLGRPELFSER